jgi:predicted ArsR family transcriptional regulator
MKISENERALEVLKENGDQSVAELADLMDMTTEGARFHLLKLEKDGLVESRRESQGRGRPKQIWSLTEKGNSRFPDTHAELSVNLIDMVRESLGEQALQKVIENHEKRVLERYSQKIRPADDLEGKVAKLAKIRTDEGYMAEYEVTEDGFLFIENHCPICSAAKACQGFCRAELNIFQAVLGDDISIERTRHILKGEQRCAYKITPKPSLDDA